MKKKTIILLVVFIFVLLLAIGVYAGIKTEFFGLLETKEENTKKDTEEEKNIPKENNVYLVEFSDTVEDIGMKTDFNVHFLKKDKSLLDMNTEITVDFSFLEEEVTEEELNEAMSSFESELNGEMGLTCKSSVNGTIATFKCSATKEEIISSIKDDDSYANMDYDKFLENMKDNEYTCSTKEVYVSLSDTTN